nr:hypothetical protein [Tanacetum cinerariifolium]
VFWGADEELSDGGPLRVIVYGYDGLPMLPVAPPSLVYIPGYVAESYLEEDPKEFEDDETEDSPVDYPMDGGDNGDDDDGDSSRYNANDEDEDEEEGRGERLARYTAPAALPSPPLPPSLYLPPPVDRKDDILESEQPPHKRLCLSTLGSRYEVGESSTRGLGVDYGFTDTVEAKIRHRAIIEVRYGIRDTWIDLAEAVPEMVPTTLEEVNTRVTELAELHEHDTQDLYALLEDAQDGTTRISQRVAMDSQRVDILMGDRMTLQETVWIVKEESYGAREAWAHSIGLSQTVHHELQTLFTDSRDSSSNKRHKKKDGRHAGRVVSTAWAAEESWTARRRC